MNKEIFLEKAKIYGSFWEKDIEFSRNNFNLFLDVITAKVNLKINEIESKKDMIIAELSAKVYTYEKIIANSNFKAINNKSIDSLNKKIKELEKEIEILKGEDNE